MALTLAQAEAHLDAWLAADLAVSTGQSYSMAGRSLERANIAEIRTQVDYWQRRVLALTSGAAGGRTDSVRIAVVPS